MRRGDKWQGELLTHKKNGNTYWANTIAAPYKNEAGQVEGYIMIQQDITDRKKMEIALMESEAKYKTLVENSQDGIIIVRDNKVIYANDTICNLLGYCPEGFKAEDIIHSQDIHKVAAIGVRRRNLDFSTINETFRLIAKNGEIKECDTTSTLIQFGGVWASFFTIHDLTESKRMQYELRQSEQKYRELTEMLPLTVYELNVENVPTYINKAGRELFGLNSTNSGNKAMSFFVSEDRDRMTEVLKNENQNAQNLAPEIDPNPSDPAEYTIQKPDGTTIPVLIYGTAVLENGKPVGSRGVIVDISERKAAENELKIAKLELEKLNSNLEKRVKESSKRLTEARTQLINLQKENLQSQYEVLKQQVNPHFLFNSLNVLTSLIKIEPDLAEKFSEQLSKVYRYVLENKDNELVDLNTELNFLDAYIFLLNIRFVGKLQVSLSIPEVNRNNKIIPLAMQLLIENAIKHNVMSKVSPLIIDIFVDSYNCLNIINNLQERPSQIVSTGVGLKNILSRYKLLELPIPVFEKTDNQFIAKIQLVK
jgi:PAS domain S-box-containing protein